MSGGDHVTVFSSMTMLRTILEHQTAASYQLHNGSTMAAYHMTNMSTTDHQPDHRHASPLSETYDSFLLIIFIAVLLGIVTLWTIAGNVMVGLALYRYRELRTMSNILIGNLALSDLLLGITVLPISAAHDLLGYWILGEVMCIIWLCIDVLYCTASIWGLCTIAVDRYTATLYPMWYHEQRSPKRGLMYILFVWVFSAVVSFAPFIGWRHMIPTLYTHNNVTQNYNCILFSSQSYVFYSASGSFILPLVLMMFLYIRIFFALHKRSLEMKNRAKLSCQHNYKPARKESATIPEKDSTDLVTVAKDSAMTPSSSGPNDESGSQKDTVFINAADGDVTVADRDVMVADRDVTVADRYVMVADDDDTDNRHYSFGYISEKERPTPVQNDGYIEGHMTDSDPGHDFTVIKNKNFYVTDSESENIQLSRYKRIKNLRSCTFASIDGDETAGCVERNKPRINLDEASEDDTIEEKIGRRRRGFSLPWIRSGKMERNKLTSSMKRRFEIREQRATKRMALIMMCFIVCWLPFFVMYTMRSMCSSCAANKHLRAAVIWLGYVNSALNPVLYTLFNEDFKRAFRRIVGMKRKPRKKR